MDSDWTFRPALPRRDHCHERRPVTAEIPERGRAQMAQCGTSPAANTPAIHGPRVRVRGARPRRPRGTHDGAAPRDPARDRAPIEPGREQLRHPDDPVLPRREPGDDAPRQRGVYRLCIAGREFPGAPPDPRAGAATELHAFVTNVHQRSRQTTAPPGAVRRSKLSLHIVPVEPRVMAHRILAAQRLVPRALLRAVRHVVMLAPLV